MNKIKFIPSHFWDKKTMTLESGVTKEQWKKVEDVCKELNDKYSTEPGCTFHPDKEHLIRLGLFNDFVDLQLQKTDTCCCHDIIEKLINIRNVELIRLNPEFFKGKF